MNLSDLKKDKVKDASQATIAGMAGYTATFSGLSLFLNNNIETAVLGCGAGLLFAYQKSNLAKKLNDKVEKITEATNKHVAEFYEIERKEILNASTIDGFFLAWGIKDVYDGIMMNNNVYLAFGTALLLWAGKRAYDHYHQAKRTSVNEYEIYQYLSEKKQKERS